MPSWWPFGKKKADPAQKEEVNRKDEDSQDGSEWGGSAASGVIYKQPPRAPVINEVVVDPFGNRDETSPQILPDSSPTYDDSSVGHPTSGVRRGPVVLFEPVTGEPFGTVSNSPVSCPQGLVKKPSALRGWVNEDDLDSPLRPPAPLTDEAMEDEIAAAQRAAHEAGDRAIIHGKGANQTADQIIEGLKKQAEVELYVDERLDELKVQIGRAKQDLQKLSKTMLKDKCCIILVIVAVLFFIMMLIIRAAKPGGGGSPPVQDIVIVLPQIPSYNSSAAPSVPSRA
eukprot:Hpha_TRINITY_DN7959_c0_g1::TRINITY_DN7959_c0_g1_i1::g.146107::m.146107